MIERKENGIQQTRRINTNARMSATYPDLRNGRRTGHARNVLVSVDDKVRRSLGRTGLQVALYQRRRVRKRLSRIEGSSDDPEEEVIDVGVDGSLVEHYPFFRDMIHEALSAIKEIGPKGAEKIRIGVAKDGSGVGAALIALVAAQMEQPGDFMKDLRQDIKRQLDQIPSGGMYFNPSC